MGEPDQPPVTDRLSEHLHDGDTEAVETCLGQLAMADTPDRKEGLQVVREIADREATSFEGLAAPLVTFLADDDRTVRLRTAKLFVTLAKSQPAAVSPVVDALAERLADDEEFYYVRARCAEALGYLAMDTPRNVTDPEILADLRIGLAFDEPEVRTKLAKALSYVALGDPSRLRHQVSSLIEHLDDEQELVRYHLCTALVVIGCAHPEKLSAAADALVKRLRDENPYVSGRAAEALALIAQSGATVDSIRELDELESGIDDPPAFLTDRTAFLREALADDAGSLETPVGLGSIESIRDGTDDIVEAITTPDGSECPHCGLELPQGGPPICPRCGGPF